MNSLFFATGNAFDIRTWLLARHAQHPVIVHFPIALFIMSAVFELLALLRKQPALESVAYFNLLAAAISIPFTIATGLLAWQWRLEGAALKGNLRIHFAFALATAVVVLLAFGRRNRLKRNGQSPRAGYF